MKHIKKFENFSFEEEEKYGRFAQERQSDVAEFGEEGNEFNEDDFDENCEFCNCCPCECEDAQEEEETNELGEEEDDYGFSEDEEDEEDDQEEHRIRRWGDEEIVEKKKMNAGFKAYLDKQKAKSKGKDDKKSGKGKPDFLDLDKDGDKKETMKKAAKDAKEDDKGTAKKGLTAGQKRLPKAMQDAILKKEGLKSMATGMVAALSLLFGSCTWVGIEDKNGNDIENIDYANKTSIGTIKEIERYGKGTLRVQFIDNNGNKIETDMQPSDFWREDTPKAGDSIKLVFDKEGKSAEVYLKDDYNKKSHRHPGGSFWQ